MKICTSWIAVVMFVFMGCRKTMVTHNVNPFDAEIFHNRTIGASANELLDDDVYKSLVVEVQFMPGYRPQQGTLDHLRTFLETYLNKPKGISIVLRQIGSVEKDSLSMEDASVVEKNNRRRFASPAKAAIYILFTDGLHPGNKILGMAYRNTSVVIYGRSVRKYSSMKGRLTHEELETAVLLHEIGPLLGLVNKGSVVQSDHVDETFQDHCNNKKCLMYHSVETKNLPAILLKGTIPFLDQHCIDDLLANGGKYVPDYDGFIKPF